jgi:hypothetical protein
LSGELTGHAEVVEPRERGLEIGPVEDFEAADRVAFDREKADIPPLGVEPFLRRPIRDMGDDGSEAAQPMHGLDVESEVWRGFPGGADVCDRVPGLESYRAPVVYIDPVRRRRG